MRFWRAIFALTLGVGSGAVAAWAGLPLPWMLGAMIGVTIAALAGAPIAAPDRLRPLVIPVIGVLLGSAITVEVLSSIGRWMPTMVLLMPFLIVAAWLSNGFYRRIGRYDPVTAYFSAMPGGLNDMLILGAAAGGEEKRIALAHATRILVVITFVVLFFGAVLGVRGGSVANWTALDALTAWDWLVLGGCAVLGVPLGKLARLPAAPILGPMLLSGAAHVSGIVVVAPPSLLVIVAQIVIGTVIGCRFLGSTLREVGRDILLGVGSSAMMIAVAVGFAVAVTRMSEIDLSQAFLAYSPGGLTEMGLLALAMGQDVAYVTVTHLVRITVVIFAAAPIFRLLRPGGR